MDKTLVALILVFFLAFTVFTTAVVFNTPLNKLIRAKEEADPSPENTITLAWPLSLKADGTEETTVSVFVRNRQNKPVANKIVYLNTTLGEIKENNIKTDNEGIAKFKLKSTVSGIAEISANINNITASTPKISVKFE